MMVSLHSNFLLALLFRSSMVVAVFTNTTSTSESEGDFEGIYMTLTLQIPRKKIRSITWDEVKDSIRILHYDRELVRRRKRNNTGICIPPIIKLPRQVLINILSRLPTKNILECSSVCKDWEKLIYTDPEFAKLQFTRSSACKWVMIRPESGPVSFSRKVWLIDVTDDHSKSYIDLVLPMNDQLTCSAVDFVNSCNGLICLCKCIDNNQIVICNPMTREYVNIPRKSKVSNMNSIACDYSLCLDYNMYESEEKLVASGFGYSIKSNQYKVIRVLGGGNSSHGFGGLVDLLSRLAEVYTIGEGKWRRSIGFAPQIPHSMSYGTYLNGKFFWVCSNDDDVCEFVVSFDFDDENFEFVMPPPCFNANKKTTSQIRMQELGGCLSFCDFSSVDYFEIWVTKEFGGQWSWKKSLVVHMWHNGLLKPLFVRNEEEVLMIENSKALVVYNALTKRVRYREIPGTRSCFGAITYAPTFFSLKNNVKGDDQMEVLIVK